MNGEHFILYTTTQGGLFHVLKGTREQYGEAVATGTVKVPIPGFFPGSSEKVKFAFIALAAVEDNHDAVLGRSRDAAVV